MAPALGHPVVAALARFPMVLPKRQYGVEIGLDASVLVFLAMTATAPDAVLIWALATVPLQLSRKKSLATRLFNTALSLVAGTAAILAMGAVATMGRTGPAEVVAVMIGGAVYFLIDYVVTAVSIALASGDALRSVMFTNTLPLALAGLLAVTCLGWLGAITLRYAPVGLPLVAVPLIAVIAAMRAVTISSRERLGSGCCSRPRWRARRPRPRTTSRRSAQPGRARCCAASRSRSAPCRRTGPPVRSVPASESARALPVGCCQWLVAARRTERGALRRRGLEVLSTLATVGSGVPAARELTAAMTRMARHDSLTGLDNRSVLRERLQAAIDWADSTAPSSRSSTSTWTASRTSTTRWATTPATSCSSRWRTACGRAFAQGDTVARMGGDEFAVAGGVGQGRGGRPRHRTPPARRHQRAVRRPR
jgi:hypothetical protein